MQKDRIDNVVAFCKDICFDSDLFTDYSLDGEAAAIDLRVHTLDNHPAVASMIPFHHVSPTDTITGLTPLDGTLTRRVPRPRRY
jgi:hypothetical protein